MVIGWGKANVISMEQDRYRNQVKREHNTMNHDEGHAVFSSRNLRYKLLEKSKYHQLLEWRTVSSQCLIPMNNISIIFSYCLSIWMKLTLPASFKPCIILFSKASWKVSCDFYFKNNIDIYVFVYQVPNWYMIQVSISLVVTLHLRPLRATDRAGVEPR